MVFDSFSETRVIIDEAFNEAYYKEKLSVHKPSLIINNLCWCFFLCYGIMLLCILL